MLRCCSTAVLKTACPSTGWGATPGCAAACIVCVSPGIRERTIAATLVCWAWELCCDTPVLHHRGLWHMSSVDWGMCMCRSSAHRTVLCHNLGGELCMHGDPGACTPTDALACAAHETAWHQRAQICGVMTLTALPRKQATAHSTGQHLEGGGGICRRSTMVLLSRNRARSWVVLGDTRTQIQPDSRCSTLHRAAPF